MKNFLLNIKFLRKCKTFPTSNGMTYIELIVVLGIWAVMSSIVMFNYQEFQAKVDIKSLASDIALKIVEAQKSALSGKWASGAPLDWKPSYGVYFDSSTGNDTTDNNIPFNKKFIYFANLDFNTNNSYDSTIDSTDKITITKNNFIENLKCSGAPINNLSIVFRRPDSKALMPCSGDVEIIVSSPAGANLATAKITVSPSGRIQVN